MAPTRRARCRFPDALARWASYRLQPCQLLFVPSRTQSVFMLEGSMVPDAVEKGPFYVNDLAKTAWLFNKLSLREQVLDLAAEMREQNVVESVNAERIPGTVHREDSGNIGVGVPLVTI